jgi:hypothetical protein
MRRVGINVIACAGLLALVGAATLHGQQPGAPDKPLGDEVKTPGPDAAKPAAKSKLEEFLAQALQNNADIRVATAKLNEAEAELHRARLQVMQKVVQSYQAVEAAKAAADFRQKEYERVKQLEGSGAVTHAIVDEREKALAAAKAQLATAEADLSFLVGKAPAEQLAVQVFRWEESLLQQRNAELSRREALLHYTAALRLAQAQWNWSKPAPGPVADKLRKALDRPITLTAEEEPLSRILKIIRDANPELHIQVQPGTPLESRVTVKLENIPLGAALQWLEDVLPAYQVVVRDYGLLLAKRESLPPRALLLNDFWKGGDKPKGAEKEGQLHREGRTGEVKAVDEQSGLLTITLGRDAGLVEGQTLEIYRLGSPTNLSKYLGKISVVEVKATEAVAKPRGALTVPPKPGDFVAERIVGN